MSSLFDNIYKRAAADEYGCASYKNPIPSALLAEMAVFITNTDEPRTAEINLYTREDLSSHPDCTSGTCSIISVIEKYNEGDPKEILEKSGVYKYHLPNFPKAFMEDMFPTLCSVKTTEYMNRKEVYTEVVEDSYDFGKMYNEFERKYNHYPVQMSRQEAFCKALNDNMITEEVYKKAREYYGNLWNYVGD